MASSTRGRSAMRAAGPDLTIAGLLFAFGLFMLVRSLGYELFGRGGRIGPGFMPFVAGALVAVFAAWVAVEVVRRARGGPAAAPPADRTPDVADEEGTDTSISAASTVVTGHEDLASLAGVAPPDTSPTEAMPSRTNRKVMVVFGLAVLATVLTYLLGYILAFGIMTFLMLAVVERERPWVSALVAAASVVVAWAVFVRVLEVPLPGGVLHILGGG